MIGSVSQRAGQSKQVMQIASFGCQGRAASHCPIEKQAINKKWNWALSHFQVVVNTFKFKAKLATTAQHYNNVLHFAPKERAEQCKIMMHQHLSEVLH